MVKDSEISSNLIQSVDRALRMLELFSSQNRELGVTEISKLLGVHKSTAFSIIGTLKNRGFLRQNFENSKYSLGLRILELGNTLEQSMEIRAIAKPEVEKMVNEYKETVHLVVAERGEVVYIDKIESPSAIQILSHVGKRNPMHATGVGKCLLAYLNDDEAEKILSKKLKKYTDNTITDYERLKDELLKIRDRGYSIDDEEMEMGLKCIAAPIRDRSGVVVAAISLSGPSMRLGKERVNELIEPVKQTALNISRELGYNIT